MKRTIICTSGTSAITNIRHNSNQDEIQDNPLQAIRQRFLKEFLIMKRKVGRPDSFSEFLSCRPDIKQEIDDLVFWGSEYYKELVGSKQLVNTENPNIQVLDNLPAEVAGLALLPMEPTDQLKLIVSDTFEGILAASIVFKCLESFNLKVISKEVDENILVVKGLQDRDMKLFQAEGLANLLENFLDERKEAVNQGRQLWLNITGGFKGILPYLTYFSVTYGIPMFYRFERSKDVVILPGFPLKWDEQYLKDLNRFFNGTHNLRFIKENQSRISPLFEDEGFQENTRYGDFVQRLIEDLVEEE